VEPEAAERHSVWPERNGLNIKPSITVRRRSQVARKEWRKPEVKTIAAGSAENGGKNQSDGKGATQS